jgi:hypothetical protein
LSLERPAAPDPVRESKVGAHADDDGGGGGDSMEPNKTTAAATEAAEDAADAAAWQEAAAILQASEDEPRRGAARRSPNKIGSLCSSRPPTTSAPTAAIDAARRATVRRALAAGVHTTGGGDGNEAAIDDDDDDDDDRLESREVVHEGWLLKKTTGRPHRWQRRWFVLQTTSYNTVFSYHNSRPNLGVAHRPAPRWTVQLTCDRCAISKRGARRRDATTCLTRVPTMDATARSSHMTSRLDNSSSGCTTRSRQPMAWCPFRLRTRPPCASGCSGWRRLPLSAPFICRSVCPPALTFTTA